MLSSNYWALGEKTSQAPPCFAVRSGRRCEEVRLSVKRELVSDDLVALSGDVVLVEKTVRMANLSRGTLCSLRRL